ncbi:FadR/GntR family transcriptional regulator [Pseudoruegeria sp. SK021]|uniref:FadR/GntR family transcriptional regulator n=1 Tax=Pseudoruegeria sp. SK021 TaxID=1933035 RepID=UPI000A2470C1|nr:FadR/GntR family transcriptional regulator [Pseudoruegeria sp. SK021]OSP55914.1 hypothetical protein BV911_04490 [Pseudoruegeria sp. SK021]
MSSKIGRPEANPSATLADGSAPRLASTVYDQLREIITDSNLVVNRRLPSEARLAELCGASRPVVRQALAQLRNDGMIVSRKGSGSYVTQPPVTGVSTLAPVSSIADVQRCFEFRIGIEPAAAALAARQWTPADIDRIDTALATLEMSILAGKLGTTEDADLHDAIARATHNPYHIGVQAQMRPHVSTGMNITRALTLEHSLMWLQLVQDEHVAVVRAIRNRDDHSAFKLMDAHIRAAQNRMFKGMGNVPDLR